MVTFNSNIVLGQGNSSLYSICLCMKMNCVVVLKSLFYVSLSFAKAGACKNHILYPSHSYNISKRSLNKIIVKNLSIKLYLHFVFFFFQHSWLLFHRQFFSKYQLLYLNLIFAYVSKYLPNTCISSNGEVELNELAPLAHFPK